VSTCWPTPMSRAACSAAWRPCAAWWASLSHHLRGSVQPVPLR
jgi:hypothetical protein